MTATADDCKMHDRNRGDCIITDNKTVSTSTFSPGSSRVAFEVVVNHDSLNLSPLACPVLGLMWSLHEVRVLLVGFVRNRGTDHES